MVIALDHDSFSLRDDIYQRRVRQRAEAVVYRMAGSLRRIRPFDSITLADRLDDAIDAGLITLDERAEALFAELVAEARRHPSGEQVVVVGEVSITVARGDVERARLRAAIVGRAFGLPALAVVVTANLPEGLDVEGVEVVLYRTRFT